MDLEEVVSCPLGHTCVEAKDGKIHRCAWHIKMQGKDQSGEDHNEWGCAIAWQPILMVEMSSTSRGVSASVDSLRNETTKRQDAALSLAIGDRNVKTINN